MAREFRKKSGDDDDEDPSEILLPRALLRFCQELRRSGVAVSTSSVMDALNAITLVDVFNRLEFHHALLTTLIKREEDQAPFERLFNSFWRMGNTEREVSMKPLVKASKHLGGEKRENEEEGTRTGTEMEEERVQQMASDLTEEVDHEDGRDKDSASVALYSPAEVLMRRDLRSLQGEDLEEIERVLRRVAREFASTKTRAMQPDERGTVDLRRTVRTNIQYGTELLKILRRRKTLRKNRLLLICDVSGSMKTYSSFAIQYLYAISKIFERIEVFLFSTQLTRVTTELQRDRFETTMKSLSDSVLHWGGGTKIGACLATLFERYGHLVNRRTIVVIISDGMDTGEITLLEDQMRKLRQRSRWVVWLNPLLGDPAYEPICRGMQAALPYVNAFTSANSVSELQSFASMLRYEPVLRARR